MADFDLIVRGGTVVDGTRMPRFLGDIGIRGGRVASVGRLADASAERVLDADGMIVAPGYVDLHTHYDAQVFWDPYCSLSGWHGVTSVAIGNCGFGFAPVRPEERERSMLSMTRNEAISLDAMRAGMPWDWVTFPQFLDSLESTPKAINVLPYMPLNPLLVWVMGQERAKAGEMPTPEEHAQMKRLLHEAMDAGACGWSTQRLMPGGHGDTQRDYDGTPMPTDIMHHETCLELARVLAERNEGFIQMTLTSGDRAKDLRAFEELAEVSGRPVIYNVLVAVAAAPQSHHDTIAWLESCRQRGLKVYPQAITTEVGFTFNLEDFNQFDDAPAWREALMGSREERLARLADPARRAGLRERLPAVATGGFHKIIVVEAHTPETRALENLSLEQIAEREGKPLADALIDVAVADDLRTTFYVDAITSSPTELLRDVVEYPWAIPGTSDGGAHTKFFTSGVYPTEFITRCVREHGMLSLEEAHWRLSALPAMCAGFRDRGTLREGAPADLIVYDYDGLEILPTELVHDLPGGDWRRVQRARGYRHVLVNGEPTIESDREVGSSPGRLLRHGAAPSRAAAA